MNLINQNWVFGRNARLNFSTNPPTPTTVSNINTFEGCASISDANGTLIMYTDGQTVWDGSGTVRAVGLTGDPSSTQSAIIVPNPGHPAQYYVFTVAFANHFNGILINTSTSTWGVTLLSSLMTMPSTAGFSPTEKVTVIQHANCKDFWVLTIMQRESPGAATGSGWLRVFLVNSTGVQHVSDTPMNVQVHDIGYLKGSRNGKRIAIANWSFSNVLVYPFDNFTGTINLPNLITIPVPILVPAVPSHLRSPYGVEFSPDSNILYYTVLGDQSTTSAGNSYVFQHNLLTAGPSVQLGMHPNAGEANRYALGALQLGINDSIYVAQDGESRLGVIATPNGPATLMFSALTLPGAAPGSVCFLGLPNLIPNLCDCACEEGNCDEAVDKANQILNVRADKKTSTIIANGQVVPPSCKLALPQTNFAPIFSLHWGDGPSDQFESHDTEIIYIRIRNPFSDLIFRGVKIFNIRITPNQTLPDGDNALQLIPAEIACFDEIAPCSYVSRDFAFLIQNAIVQGYQIAFDYCIEEIAIVAANNGSALFGIKVVAS